MEEHDNRLTRGLSTVYWRNDGRSSFLAAHRWTHTYLFLICFKYKACPGTIPRAGWGETAHSNEANERSRFEARRDGARRGAAWQNGMAAIGCDRYGGSSMRSDKNIVYILLIVSVEHHI